MKLGHSRNQCGACSEYFNSTSAFEMHRTGVIGVNRRCMTPQEMEAKKMSKNTDGFWVTKVFDRDALRRKLNEDTIHNENGDSDRVHV
jgi:hypothetical protein